MMNNVSEATMFTGKSNQNPKEADRYAIRIQMFVIPDATRSRNDNQQITRTIVACM